MAEKKINSILQAETLSVGYSSKKETTVIASNINCNLTKGSLVALVGSNGIGKSTLLRTLAGMQQPLNGTVYIQQKPLNDYDVVTLAKNLSVVLTNGIASKNLTVLELVSLGRQPYTNWMGSLTNEDKQIINKALKATETTIYKNRSCFELSDGQLQRVYIARALAQDTPLIILDEPTSHLDLYHKAATLKLLKKIAVEHHKTVLYATHEIDLAIQLADKMMVMTNDKTICNTPCNLIEQGVFDTLFNSDFIFFDRATGRFKMH